MRQKTELTYFSLIEWNLVRLALIEFKDSFAIDDHGQLKNYYAGEILYKSLSSDCDNGDLCKDAEITEEEKKEMWLEAKGYVDYIESLNPCKYEEDLINKKERLSKLRIRIYRTIIVELILNFFSHQGVFIDMDDTGETGIIGKLKFDTQYD